MSELDFHPTSTFVIWATPSPDELAMIEAYGDRLTAKAIRAAPSGRHAWCATISASPRLPGWKHPQNPSRIYDRMQGVARALNEQGLSVRPERLFGEPPIHFIYHGTEGGHYDWHIDQRPLCARGGANCRYRCRSVDGSQYEASWSAICSFHAGNKIETAPRERGTVIAFPSYVLHRVTPVVPRERARRSWPGPPGPQVQVTNHDQF